MPEGQGQVISWDVITHVHTERSTDWYWALGVITLVAAGLSIWLGNTLFAIILVVGAGSLGVLVARGPREHNVSIDNRGLSIDGTLHRFNSIQSFWVYKGGDETAPRSSEPKLYLTLNSIMTPHMSLPLESIAQAEQVRSFLRRHISEVEQEPHMGEHLAEMLGL